MFPSSLLTTSKIMWVPIRSKYGFEENILVTQGKGVLFLTQKAFML